MKRITAVVTMICLWASVSAMTLATTGCSVSTNEIVQDGTAVGNAVLQIAQSPAFAAAYPVQAAQMVTGANALLALTNGWKTGDSTAEIMAAASALQIILAAIPATSNNPWVQLIPIAAAAIAILIAAIQNNSPAVTAKRTTAEITKAYKSGVIKHRLGRSLAGDFNAAWVKAGGKPLK